MQEKLKRTEGDRDELEKEVNDLKAEIAVKKTETEREGRKKDRLEKETKEIKQTLETRQFEIQQKQTQVSGTYIEISLFHITLLHHHVSY